MSCADRLISIDHASGPELRSRAVLEIRAAEEVADVEAALRAKDLKRANAELTEVWPGSVMYPEIKRKYDRAEARAIEALAMQLVRVTSPGCKEYDALLAQERALKPARVTAQAAHQVPCRPPDDTATVR